MSDSDQTTGVRLSELRIRSELSVRAFAEACGYATGSGVQRYIEESYDKPLPLQVAQAMADALQGRGDPPIKRSEVIELTGLSEPYRPDPDFPPSRSVDAGETASIIRLDLSLPMGPGALIDDYVEEEPVLFDLSYINALTKTPAHRLRLARGVGDSMMPTLQTTDEVWIDTTQNQLLHSDRVYAASINGGAAIKRLRPIEGGKRILVISDNKSLLEPYAVDANEVRIWGRVLRFARDL